MPRLPSRVGRLVCRVMYGQTCNRGPCETSSSGRANAASHFYGTCLGAHIARLSPTLPKLKLRAASALQETSVVQELLGGAVKRTDAPQFPSPQVPDAADLVNTSSRRALLSGCEAGRQTPLKVALLLSGGVDSSLALHLLQEAGHRVTAFYLQIWFQEDFRNFWGSCPWEEDLDVCKQVCQKEGVPLVVVPLTQQYWDRVVAHSVSEIRSGRTPNPDILCNSRIKFGAFYEFLESHHGSTFDRVASGHYAHIIRDSLGTEPVKLALTPDAVKDQTYFLAHLTQQQLSRAVFPLGNLTKAEVRSLAAAAGLPNQSRRDSQGICFLGKVRFEEFVREHLGTWPGPLVEEESNRIVGFHEGFWFYTPGQRKGIMLSGGPWYVSRKDCRRNVVYISRQYYVSDKQRSSFRCGHFSWISGSVPQAQQLQCKVRHGPQIYHCTFMYDEREVSASVQLDGNDQGLAPGQYAVFYLDGICLGSALILEAIADTSCSTATQAKHLAKAFGLVMPISGAFFGATLGLTIQFYSNAVRKLPLMHHPWEHLLAAGAGAYAGNWLVQWEQKAGTELQEMLEKRQQSNKRLQRGG